MDARLGTLGQNPTRAVSRAIQPKNVYVLE